MARARSFEPRRLDVAAFADAAAELSGEVDQRSLARLAAAVPALPGDALPAPVHWQVRGEARPVAGGRREVRMHLKATTSVALECQRCLQPLSEPLAVDRWFRFVADEDEAARLDELSEDDVLVSSRSFDLLALVEDELILALPLIPRHDTCPQPLPVPPADTDEAAEAPNPFAALAVLRRPD